MMGIVGLPIPDETLLTFSGYLIYKHSFVLPLAFAAAFAGSACGISISYWLGRNVRVHSGAAVEGCVILDNCDIGRRSKLRRVILDKNVRIPEDAEIGYDEARDRRHHHVTESGIVVIGGARTPVEITGLVV